MTQILPKAWENLKFPQWRQILIDTLRDILALDDRSGSAIDDVFHFFFDDTDLASDPVGQIGTCLLSDREASLVTAIVEALDAMLDRIGDQDTAAFFHDKSWGIVQRSTKTLLDELLKTGEMQF